MEPLDVIVKRTQVKKIQQFADLLQYALRQDRIEPQRFNYLLGRKVYKYNRQAHNTFY